MASVSDAISRQEEESRLVHAFLRQLPVCMGEQHATLYRDALALEGLQIESLTSRLLNFDQFDRILIRIRRQLPDITLKLYSSLQLIDLGLISYAASSSDTLGKALEIATRYHALTSNRYDQSFKIQGQTARFRPYPFSHYETEIRDISEDCLAGDWHLLRKLMSTEVDLQQASAHFAYPAPDYVDTYRDVFQCPCYFDAEQSELRFPAAWCDYPLATGSWQMADICEDMCTRLLHGHDAESDTANAVRRLLITRPSRRMMGLEEAAKALRLSASQLRNQLYRAGTNYKTLVLEVRMTLGRHYLQATQLSVQEIAYLLDYSQTAPFDRAFKNYFGITPGQFRDGRYDTESGHLA